MRFQYKDIMVPSSIGYYVDILMVYERLGIGVFYVKLVISK